MSIYLPDVPAFIPPVEVVDQQSKKLSTKIDRTWLGWLRNLNRAVQDLQASYPVYSQFGSIISGPGPVTVTVNLTMRRAGILTIMGSLIQTWATAAPSWSVQVSVDGGTVWNTGTISNTWQNVVSPVVQQAVAAGTHQVVMTWTTGNANASITSGFLAVTPSYTS